MYSTFNIFRKYFNTDFSYLPVFWATWVGCGKLGGPKPTYMTKRTAH